VIPVIIVLALLALIAFDLLAVRSGFDSRNTRSVGLTSSWCPPKGE
jgi:hypothetical protein